MCFILLSFYFCHKLTLEIVSLFNSSGSNWQSYKSTNIRNFSNKMQICIEQTQHLCLVFGVNYYSLIISDCIAYRVNASLTWNSNLCENISNCFVSVDELRHTDVKRLFVSIWLRLHISPFLHRSTFNGAIIYTDKQIECIWVHIWNKKSF